MKKKLHTQRARVLLQIGGVVLLAALLAGARGYTFTPNAAIAQMEDLEGLEETRVLKEVGDLAGGNGKLYFAATDHAAVLYGLDFAFRDGWNWNGCSWVDCTGDAPFYAAASRFTLTYREVIQLWCFGRVTDPEVASVTVRGIDSDTGQPTGDANTTRLDSWITQNGKRYFVFDAETEGLKLPCERLLFTACDSGGKELYRAEVERENHYLSK